MGYRFSASDIAFLRSAEGAAALAEVGRLALTAHTQLADIAGLRARLGSRTPVLVETVLLRRRASAKLVDCANWLFTDEALQQATPTAVAQHRAGRLAGRDVHDVTCSIGADLAALVPVARTVIGSDLDSIRLDIAAHNVPGAVLVRADALTPVSRGTAIIADPARRSGGRRTRDPAALMPPLPALLEVYRGRDLAVKCAPGLDFDRLRWPGEVELTSLDGGVREACLWSEGLSRAALVEEGPVGAGPVGAASDGPSDGVVRRRATVLTTAVGGGVASWEITDLEPDEIPERPPGEWIVDPDGAVVRAGLVRQFAARHGLWQLDPRIAYLTGDRLPTGIAGFRVVEQLKYTEKALRQELARLNCGSLEILVRGVDVDPALLRPMLKLRGSRPMSVVLSRFGRSAAAFICEPRVTARS